MKKIIIGAICACVFLTLIIVLSLNSSGKIKSFDEIKFQRKACFGSCPVYEITIKADGSFIYRGERYVENVGEVRGILSEDQISDLIAAFNEADFIDLSNIDFSQECRTDASSIYIGLKIGTKKFGTYDYQGNCNKDRKSYKKLIELELSIDEITNSVQWVGTRKDWW